MQYCDTGNLAQDELEERQGNKAHIFQALGLTTVLEEGLKISFGLMSS